MAQTVIRALAVTVSNRAAAGVYEDKSGPVLVELLRSAGCAVDGPLVIPDGEPVEAALQRLGTIRFRKVAMQPGMPQGFGTVALASGTERVPIFTLPGNPVSAYVSFQVFARPAIGALQAYDGLGLKSVQAELTGSLRSPPGRRSFLRGVLDRSRRHVTPLTGQGSHQVATLGKANALVVVPESVEHMAEGETAEVLILP